MSVVMDEEIKRRTARQKSALVLEIIQGKTTVAEASRAFYLTPVEIESWVKDDKSRALLSRRGAHGRCGTPEQNYAALENCLVTPVFAMR